MSDNEKVEIYGMTLDARCAKLLEIVMRHAYSEDTQERAARHEALEKLGEINCTESLLYIAERLTLAVNWDARETRRRALEILG